MKSSMWSPDLLEYSDRHVHITHACALQVTLASTAWFPMWRRIIIHAHVLCAHCAGCVYIRGICYIFWPSSRKSLARSAMQQ